MSDHFISWPDILSTHLKIVIFVTALWLLLFDLDVSGNQSQSTYFLICLTHSACYFNTYQCY